MPSFILLSAQVADWNASLIFFFLFGYLDLKKITFLQVVVTRKHASEPSGQNWPVQAIPMLHISYRDVYPSSLTGGDSERIQKDSA